MAAPTSTTITKDAEKLYAALLGSGFKPEQGAAVVAIANNTGMEESLLRDVEALRKAKEGKDLPTIAKKAQGLAETLMDVLERGGDPAKLGAALTALTGDKGAGAKLAAASAGKKKSEAANEILHPTKNADGTPLSPDSPPVFGTAERQQALKDWHAGRDASKAALAALTAELTEGLFAASRGNPVAAVKPEPEMRPTVAAAPKLKIVMAREGSGIESSRSGNEVTIGDKDQEKLAGFMKARGLSDVAAAYELMEKEFNAKRKVSTGTQTKPADMFAAYNDKGELDGPQRVQTVAAPPAPPAPAPVPAVAEKPEYRRDGTLKVTSVELEGGTKMKAEDLQRLLKDAGLDIGKFGPNKDGIDNDAGNATWKAVDKMRTKLGLGNVGDRTLHADDMKHLVALATGQERLPPDIARHREVVGSGKRDNELTDADRRAPAPAPALAQGATRTAKGKIEGADIFPIAASLKDANQDMIAETMRKALAAYEGETALEKVRKFQVANNLKPTGVVGPEEFGKAGMQLAMQGMKQEPAPAPVVAKLDPKKLSELSTEAKLELAATVTGDKGALQGGMSMRKAVAAFQERHPEIKADTKGTLDGATMTAMVTEYAQKKGHNLDAVVATLEAEAAQRVAAKATPTRVASGEQGRGG